MKPRSLDGVMKRVSILYLAIIAALLGVIAAMGYTFLVTGKTVPAEDKRSAIVLEPAERSLVLTEMRGFLIAVQAITEAVTRTDARAIAAAARPMGMAAAGACRRRSRPSCRSSSSSSATVCTRISTASRSISRPWAT